MSKVVDDLEDGAILIVLAIVIGLIVWLYVIKGDLASLPKKIFDAIISGLTSIQAIVNNVVNRSIKGLENPVLNGNDDGQLTGHGHNGGPDVVVTGTRAGNESADGSSVDEYDGSE